MLALSVRQPYAELILRGIKTVEFRSRPTRIVGERFYLYASKGGGNWRAAAERAADGNMRAGAARAWSLDLAMAGDRVPPWMAELANALRLFPDADGGAGLPTGFIVGSAVIEKVTPGTVATRSDGFFHWHLTHVERLSVPRQPKGHPQPVWWRDEA